MSRAGAVIAVAFFAVIGVAAHFGPPKPGREAANEAKKNGFGAMAHTQVACVYDLGTRQAVDIRLGE